MILKLKKFAIHASISIAICASSFSKEETYLAPYSLINTQDEQSPLLSQSFESELLEWHASAVFKNKESTTLQKASYFTGNAFGLMASASFTVLGYKFGIDISHKLLLPARQTIALLFAAGSTIPIAMICMDLTSQFFATATNRISGNEKIIFKDTRSIKVKNIPAHTRLAIEAIIGGYSAIPMAYITKKELYPVAGYATWLFIVPTFIVKSVVDGWSIHTVLDTIATTITNPIQRRISTFSSPIKTKQFYLIDKLNEAEDWLWGMSDTQVTRLTNNIMDLVQTHNGTEPELIHQALTLLFSPEKILSADEIVIPATRPSMAGQIISSAVGGVFGAWSMACVEPLSEVPINTILGLVGIHNPLVTKIFSWGTTATAASLVSWATADSFGKLYTVGEYATRKVVNKIKGNIHNTQSTNYSAKDIALRSGIAVTTLILAAIGTAPQIKISMDYLGYSTWFQQFALASSLIGPLAMNFWPLDTKLAGLAAQSNVRAQLLSMIEKIKLALPLMKDETIETYYRMIKPQENI